MTSPSRIALSISLLGGFTVDLQDAPVTGFESDKARALLAYLVVEAERPHRRDKLAGLLWPEWPDRDARANLRHVLNNLRTILGDRDRNPPFLAADCNTIQFGCSDRYWLDVDAIETARSLGNAGLANLFEPHAMRSLEEAVACYQGPFMEGFFLDGCVAFEEWLLMTRERLENSTYALLQALASHHEQCGESDEALTYTRQMLALDPLREDTHRRLMRLLALGGQRTATLVQFEDCRRLLADELGVEPGQETTALHQRIQLGELTPESTESIQTSGTGAASARSPRHTLPAPTTSLVGRRQEITALGKLLRADHTRLVTLTGPGGVGKTRLALEVARDLLDEFDGGVHFVPLASLREPDQLIPGIAGVLEVRESGSRTLERAVEVALRDRCCLLLLDNFEHILPAAPVVTDLLAAAPRLKVLVTSRSRLSLYGEHVVAVDPLPVHAQGNAPTQSRRIPHSDAVELFARRARWVTPRFVLDDDTHPAVDTICQYLDGLPLAIELAAARVNRFPPAVLLDRLTETDTASLTVLADGPRDAPQRHWSVRDTVGWSYDLLDPVDQALFRRLAVFTGGFSIPAAEAVCGAVGQDSIAVEERIWGLTENHLLRRLVHDGDEARFMLMETVRQFGWECLRTRSELDQTRRAHAKFFTALAEMTEPSLGRLHDMPMIDVLELEINNVRAALLWAMENRDVDIALRLSGELYDFWYTRGHYSEGYGWLVRALRLAGDQPPSRAYARTLHGAGFMARVVGKAQEASELFQKSRQVNEMLGDKPALGDSLVQLGNTYQILGESAKARQYRELSLAIFREHQLPWDISMALSGIGDAAMVQGDLEEAETFLQEGFALAESLEDPFSYAFSLLGLGNLSYLRGDMRRARQLFEDCRDLSRDIGLDILYARVACDIAMLGMECGDLSGAQALLVEGLAITDRLGFRLHLPRCLEAIAYLLVKRQDLKEALVLAGAIQALHDSMGTVSTSPYWKRYDESIAEARQELGQVEAEAAYAQGQQMTAEETVAFAEKALAHAW